MNNNELNTNNMMNNQNVTGNNPDTPVSNPNPQPAVAQNIMGANSSVDAPATTAANTNNGPVIGNQVPFNNPDTPVSNPNPQPVVTTPEVSEMPVDNTVPEKKKGGSALVITIIVLLLVIGGLVFFFYKGKNNDTPADDNTNTPVEANQEEENSFKLASSLCAKWFKEKLDLYKTNPEDESLDKSLTSIFTSTDAQVLNDELITACGMETADIDAANSKIKILEESRVCLLVSAVPDGNYVGMGTFNSDGIDEGTETNFIVAGDCVSFE